MNTKQSYISLTKRQSYISNKKSTRNTQKEKQQIDTSYISKGYMTLENNPKQIRTLIGLKPCFYNSIETRYMFSIS